MPSFYCVNAAFDSFFSVLESTRRKDVKDICITGCLGFYGADSDVYQCLDALISDILIGGGYAHVNRTCASTFNQFQTPHNSSTVTVFPTEMTRCRMYNGWQPLH